MAALPVAAFAWAGLAFAACPPPPPPPPAAGRPATDLPRADLPPGQPAYVEVTYPPTGGHVLVAVILAAAMGLAVWATLWTAVPLVLAAGFVLLLLTIRLTVDARGLCVGFGPWGWPRITVPLREIVSAAVTTVYPLEWGGWGYRIRRDGARGVILRRGPGVELELSGGRRFVASVREPATVAALVNALVDRDRG